MTHSLKIYFKVALYMLCTTCLLYQTFDLYAEYSSGKSVVFMVIKRQEEEPIPAVTICTKNWLSMKKISKYNNKNSEDFIEFAKIYDQYLDILSIKNLSSANTKD